MNTVTALPLTENFLDCLAKELVRRHHIPSDPLELSRVTVLLPHRRGAVYLRHYLSEGVCHSAPRPYIPPRIVTVEDFVNEVAVTLESPPRRPLSRADQAWLLYQIVGEEPDKNAMGGSWDRFFPWGIRLAALCEAMDQELVNPRNIPYPEGVPPEGAVLLERLKILYEKFQGRLEEGGFTTQGKRFRLVADHADEIALPDGPMYVAGLYALTNSEDRLFRRLFDAGARIFWHADGDNLPPLYERWRQTWGLDIETMGRGIENLPHPRLHEAYDLHTELRLINELLPERVTSPDQCALILPDPSALVPTLYAMPPGPLNISLGYPLESTAVAALLDQLATLEAKRNVDGAYHHEDYVALIKHPYVRRLPTSSGKDGRIVLHLLEEKIRAYGTPFFRDTDIVDLLSVSENPDRDHSFLAAEDIDGHEAAAHVSRLNERLLAPWRSLTTPAQLASAIREVVRFLFEPFLGRDAFVREHPLDNEFVYALQETVIPTLENALFAHQPMEKALLFSLLKSIVHTARAPFEGHPLVGLQIMGLLETRLLSFDKVFVIDVNESVIPAHEEVNPLLPETLRAVVGLPGREREEAITRYHFDRLVHSAKEAHLLWQSATLPASTGLEGKKMRSRFIEKLLWEREQGDGMLLEAAVSRAPLTISSAAFLREEGLPKSPADFLRVENLLRARSAKIGLSATLFDRYLTCPLQFYYADLLGLKASVSVMEDVDAIELGSVIHEALQDYLMPFIKKSYVRARHNDPDRLVRIFAHHFSRSTMYRCLPPAKRFFLEHTVTHRLKAYLSRMSEATFIESLEQAYHTHLETDMGRLYLFGMIDRIDSRNGCRIVLDYKTGRVQAPTKSHFERRLLPFDVPRMVDRDGLKTIKSGIGDLQLPLYVLLVTEGNKMTIGQTLAAYVELSNAGDEIFFIPRDRLEGWRDAYISWYSETFPSVLRYLIRHMVEAPLFYPATDEGTCRFCDYAAICRFSFS